MRKHSKNTGNLSKDFIKSIKFTKTFSNLSDFIKFIERTHKPAFRTSHWLNWEQFEHQKSLFYYYSFEGLPWCGLVPGSGRSSGEENGNPFQYSSLENPMDRGAWQATVHGVTRVGRDLATKPLPVVKNLPSNAGDGGLIPDQGVKISHAMGHLNPRAATAPSSGSAILTVS